MTSTRSGRRTAARELAGIIMVAPDRRKGSERLLAQAFADLDADYDHLVEREREVAREMLARETAVTRSISVPKADYDHLVEVAREATDRITKTGERPARRGGYVEHLVEEVHTPDDPGCVICGLRALIDPATRPQFANLFVPATPEPVEGESK